VNDAWIIGIASDLVAAADRALAQLGYQPRLIAPDDARLAPSPEHDDRPPASSGNGRPADAGPALVVLVDDVERIAGVLTGHEDLGEIPLIVVADASRLTTGGYAAIGHELIVHPFTQGELETRVARARFAVVGPGDADVVVSGSLELNTATYQVKVDGVPIDFTYMEYELLKFLVTHPNRVFSREALLSNVWGYDYYGGARTVDVHIRRLRAKLGQQHAERIRTLRSVGYRWDSP
jgi:DNA-binding response OmpR family regulator